MATKSPDLAAARCARCDYVLAGLPESHTCPECGLEYDLNCVVVPLPDRQSEYNQIASATFLLAIAILGGVSSGHYYAMIVLVSVSVLILVHHLLRAAGIAQRYVRLEISKRGLRFFHMDWREDRISWFDVKRAKCGWILGNLHLHDADGKQVKVISPAALGGSKAAKDCAARINYFSAVYR